MYIHIYIYIYIYIYLSQYGSAAPQLKSICAEWHWGTRPWRLVLRLAAGLRGGFVPRAAALVHRTDVGADRTKGDWHLGGSMVIEWWNTMVLSSFMYKVGYGYGFHGSKPLIPNLRGSAARSRIWTHTHILVATTISRLAGVHPHHQREFQQPKMDVLYLYRHIPYIIRPYFAGIFPWYSLINALQRQSQGALTGGKW